MNDDIDFALGLDALQRPAANPLSLPDSLIFPRYDGQSLVNLPATVCHWLGVPPLGAPPLRLEVADPDARPRRVVHILVDALGLDAFRRFAAADETQVWNRLARQGTLAAITSTAPSTTTTALPTLWSGLTPAEHGMLGYELWLREYGVVANMITQSPMSFEGGTDLLERAGFRPEGLIPGTKLGTHLKMHGVAAHAFLHYTITRSGLSRSFLQDVEVHPFGGLADLWVSVRGLLERERGPLYVWVYWSHVDSLGHRFGPRNERVRADFALFSLAFERYFLNTLPADARRGTRLMLTADHGQVFTPRDPRYDLRHHPTLTGCLPLLPTGENRMIYLFLRPDAEPTVRTYVQRTWPGEFLPIGAQAAVEAGLFGNPARQHPRLRDRLGDLLLIPTGNAYLWWAEKDNPLLGRHGGLSAEEMIVPLLVRDL